LEPTHIYTSGDGPDPNDEYYDEEEDEEPAPVK